MGELTDKSVLRRSLEMLQGLLSDPPQPVDLDLSLDRDVLAFYALAKAIAHDHYHGGVVPVTDIEATTYRLASALDAIMKRHVGHVPTMKDPPDAESADRSDQLEQDPR